MCLSLVVATSCVVDISRGSAQGEGPAVATTRKIVARVNGKPLYEDQLKPQVESSLRKFRKYGMQDKDSDLVRRLRTRALDRIIGEELISQESQKLKIEDIDERVKQALAAVKSKHGTEEKLERYLKARNLTREDVSGSSRAKVYVDEYLRRQGILEPVIPEERIRETYAANRDSYKREETIKASHILVGVSSTAEPGEKGKARLEAEKIRKEILEGKDFAEMAKKHSDCNSAPGGGDLRYIKKGFMPPEFEQVAFAMEKDAVSEVVATKFGYHIIKVLDKKPAGISPYEDAKLLISKFLQQEESKKKLAAHIAELKSKAKIEILLAE
ncbi:MAG: peptidylprolyl isomerase [Pirellulaceae bacterium]